jgi:hypothetical protein
MAAAKTLEINGYRGAPVPHTFFQQEKEADHLAILLPGVGYSAHMPLLYYPLRLSLDLGADALRVEYAYAARAEYGALSAQEQARWLLTDVTAACRAALAQRRYREITLVGKSLGTLAMGHLLTAEPDLSRAQAIWLTPLLWNEPLRTQIQRARPRSLFAIGTADTHYNAAYLAELKAATGGEAVVVEGANHSLEIAGDVMGSLRALERVMRAVQAFLFRR